MQHIEHYFKSLTESKTPHNLYEPIEYILNQGGKRIRPQLVNLGTIVFGGDTSAAIHPAAAFEMLHNFTLIHDDIMDNAPMRRGQESVYKKWNTNIAILSGDALANMAMLELLKTPVHSDILIKLIELLGKTSLEVCEGQQLDLDFETSTYVTIDQYIGMIRKKTAVLLAGCLKAGALISNASPIDQEKIYQYGINLGITFQLKDDLFDVYANEQLFGKQLGGDIRSNKKTYLYLLALEKANEKQKEELIRWFSCSDEDDTIKFNAVKAIFDQLNILQHTETVIEYYIAKAIEYVKDLTVEVDKKELLIHYANELAKRNK